MESLSVPQTQPRRRRHFSFELKVNIVPVCLEAGVSVYRIALDNQLNANLLRLWIREGEQAAQVTSSPAYMPLAGSAASTLAASGGAGLLIGTATSASMWLAPVDLLSSSGWPSRPISPGVIARGVAMIRIGDIWLATAAEHARRGAQGPGTIDPGTGDGATDRQGHPHRWTDGSDACWPSTPAIWPCTATNASSAGRAWRSRVLTWSNGWALAALAAAGRFLTRHTAGQPPLQADETSVAMPALCKRKIYVGLLQHPAL